MYVKYGLKLLINNSGQFSCFKYDMNECTLVEVPVLVRGLFLYFHNVLVVVGHHFKRGGQYDSIDSTIYFVLL